MRSASRTLDKRLKLSKDLGFYTMSGKNMRSRLQPRQLLLFILAGWINRKQHEAIECLLAENRIRRDTLGKSREILDDVLSFNEDHLLRLAKDYLSYHHTDRDVFEMDTRASRLVAPKPSDSTRAVSSARLSGLHHRYDWKHAA